MKFKIKEQNENVQHIVGDTMSRDGDWLLINQMVDKMEPRTFPNAADIGGTQTVLVATGAKVPQPVAMFYKPISVVTLAEPKPEPAAEESADVNDA